MGGVGAEPEPEEDASGWKVSINFSTDFICSASKSSFASAVAMRVVRVGPRARDTAVEGDRIDWMEDGRSTQIEI